MPLSHIWWASGGIIYRIHVIASFANPIILIDQQTLCRLRFHVIALRLIYVVEIIYIFATCRPLFHILCASGDIIYSIHVIGYFTIPIITIGQWTISRLRLHVIACTLTYLIEIVF